VVCGVDSTPATILQQHPAARTVCDIKPRDYDAEKS